MNVEVKEIVEKWVRQIPLRSNEVTEERARQVLLSRKDEFLDDCRTTNETASFIFHHIVLRATSRCPSSRAVLTDESVHPKPCLCDYDNRLDRHWNTEGQYEARYGLFGRDDERTVFYDNKWIG